MHFYKEREAERYASKTLTKTADVKSSANRTEDHSAYIIKIEKKRGRGEEIGFGEEVNKGRGGKRDDIGRTEEICFF